MLTGQVEEAGPPIPARPNPRPARSHPGLPHPDPAADHGRLSQWDGQSEQVPLRRPRHPISENPSRQVLPEDLSAGAPLAVLDVCVCSSLTRSCGEKGAVVLVVGGRGEERLLSGGSGSPSRRCQGNRRSPYRERSRPAARPHCEPRRTEGRGGGETDVRPRPATQPRRRSPSGRR